jgi:carboxylesterase type B
MDHQISKFGGDPSKVIIWGESAGEPRLLLKLLLFANVIMTPPEKGSGSVIQHVVADNGNTQPPLFHLAMTSSTYLPSQYAFNDSISEVRQYSASHVSD